MIEKVVRKQSLQDSYNNDDLAFWLSKTPEERIEAVEYLRRQYYGSSIGFQKIARVVRRIQR